MLTGPELLEFVEANPELNDTELATETGYTRITKGGKEQVLIKKFYAAMLTAKGHPVNTGRPVKVAKFSTTVHRSGVLLLGKLYAEKFGATPGDQFDIVLTDEYIKLVPTGERVELRSRNATAVAEAPEEKAPPVKATKAAPELALVG